MAPTAILDKINENSNFNLLWVLEKIQCSAMTEKFTIITVEYYNKASLTNKICQV